MHWAFSNTRRPTEELPRPAESLSRNSSNSAYLYFDSRGLSLAISGREGSLGNVWANHFDQAGNSAFQSPSSPPKRLSLAQWRNSSTIFQRSMPLSFRLAVSSAR